MGSNHITTKQEAFCQSIASGEFNYIWEAYAAHYNISKMTRNTTYQESCKLLSNPKVAQRVKDIKSEIKTKSQSTLNEVLLMMSQRLRLSVKDFYDDDGKLIQPKDWTDIQGMCVQEFETRVLRDGSSKIVKIKLESIRGIWDMFMKKFGAYVSTIKIDEDSLDHISDLLSEINGNT